MGTLLGISKEVTAVDSGILDVVNANARNIQLLKNLGLTTMLSVDEEGVRWAKEREQVSPNLEACEDGAPLDKKATANVMLEAHEALANARPENAARFEDVIHFLKEDLKTNEARSGG